jgi:hypothetical protein
MPFCLISCKRVFLESLIVYLLNGLQAANVVSLEYLENEAVQLPCDSLKQLP